MSLTTIAFFNNKGGVGKTTLVYHLAWMFSELGLRVIAADLDPQANLTSAMLSDERIEELVDGPKTPGRGRTLREMVDPLIERSGDVMPPHIEAVVARGGEVASNVGLLCGDLQLHDFEDMLAQAWSECLDDNAPKARSGFRVISAFYRLIARAASEHGARVALIDVGPNLGAINRAALVAADYVVVPLAPDLFSLKGLRNVGRVLHEWSEGWSHRLANGQRTRAIPNTEAMPGGTMRALGYVILQGLSRSGSMPLAQQRWLDQIPRVYREAVLGRSALTRSASPDPHRLGVVKHYHSLVQLAQEARAPMFLLKPADGAIGAYSRNVLDARDTFEALARRIAVGAQVPLDEE